MGTITTRKRADGSQSYTAQIRLKEGGQVIYSEAQTFSRKVLASEWLRRREYELEQERASGQALHKKVSVGELLRDYVSAAENVTEWGRSKKADIARLQSSGLADLQATKLTVQDLMGYAKKRRTEDEAGPATVLNDMPCVGVSASSEEAWNPGSESRMSTTGLPPTLAGHSKPFVYTLLYHRACGSRLRMVPQPQPCNPCRYHTDQV
jgi:hypothetical protein